MDGQDESIFTDLVISFHHWERWFRAVFFVSNDASNDLIFKTVFIKGKFKRNKKGYLI